MTTPYAEINWAFIPLKDTVVLPPWETKGRIHFLNRSCLTDECVTHLSQLNLFPFSIQLFVEPPFGYNPIHVDGFDSSHNLPAINWDLTHGQGQMKWFCLKDGVEVPKIKTTTSGTPYLQFKENECNMLHEHIIKGPCLVNTGVPHSLKNLNDSPRYCLSIRFFATITFDYIFTSLKEKDWLR